MNYAKIEGAKKYMDQNYADIKSIREAADYVGMNYEYFIRSFRSANGISPMKYLDTLRVREAHELLVITEFKCYSIARLVGHEDEDALYKLFKRYGYKNPSLYRSGNSYKKSEIDDRK